MGNGEDSGTWGSITNTNWELIEQAVSGVQTITMSNANYTLSSLNGVTDEARNMVLVVNGTNSAIYQVIAPLAEKLYVISNNTVGGYAITIGGATGSIITVPNGTTVQVYCDGTSFYSAQTSSAGNFNINGNATVLGNLTVSGTFNYVPTGVIQMWPTVTAPAGFLLCNGTAVSRTTYAALFAVIGTVFGAGDTTTTFNLPNYVNRMPYGATIGATGGSADATLVSHNHPGTSTSISDPSHAHGVNDPGHQHVVNMWVGNGLQGADGTAVTGNSQQFQFSNFFGAGADTNGTGIGIAANTTGISASTSVATQGASATNANLPPYLGIAFIIKT